jgi:cob(I)alamin adenosyltransferase
MSSESKPKKNPQGRRVGLIIVHTGNGKGKTTAALGTAFRACGVGFRVKMIQFIKGSWDYGELHSARKLGNFEIVPMGEGFTETKPGARHPVAWKTWEACRDAIEKNQHDLLIFDEINNAIAYGYLDVQVVIEALKRKPPDMHVILTGRDAHPEVIELADTVSEIVEIKHAYRKEIEPQPGVDY